MKQTVCLLNDSFPPLIDGVANTVLNYAEVLADSDCYEPAVITPSHPEGNDNACSYPVIRYPSIDMRSATGYMAGVPFSPEIVKSLSDKRIALLHSHCPIMSTVLARELRQIWDVPIVLTYHTKFDVDIAHLLKSPVLQAGTKHALAANIQACDEVWVVSQGAADNLHSLGYDGDCIVMPNGVDLPRGRVSDAAIAEATRNYDLPAGVPVYLFVGRLMWYKGLKIILDALAKMHQNQEPFRMVFIGSGSDGEEIQHYAALCGIADKCFFTGAIHDREILRSWYCRADLFLFPSTFDTNGLVVREAAACSLASVLIDGSCAAEGVTDKRNALLISESSDSLYACLHGLGTNLEKMHTIGQYASKELYFSWSDSVQKAMERYEIVIDRYQSGAYPSRHRPIEDVLRTNGVLMEELANLQNHRAHLREHLKNLHHKRNLP